MKYTKLISPLRKNNFYSEERKFLKNSFSSIFPPICIRTFPKIDKPSELNFFKKIHITEPQHSRILGDLLNPFGSHNEGSVFLKLFFDILKIDYEDKEIWNVTVETERFDIRIATKSLDKIIIVENKSNGAEDQPNQLYRYWYEGIYLPQLRLNNTKLKKILYLCSDDFKSPSEQSLSRPENYDKSLPLKVPIEIDILFFTKEIISWLEKCLEITKDKLELYYFIKQYYDFWRY